MPMLIYMIYEYLYSENIFFFVYWIDHRSSHVWINVLLYDDHLSFGITDTYLK